MAFKTQLPWKRRRKSEINTQFEVCIKSSLVSYNMMSVGSLQSKLDLMWSQDLCSDETNRCLGCFIQVYKDSHHQLTPKYFKTVGCYHYP